MILITKKNFDEVARLLWPVVCNTLKVAPETLVRPEIGWTTREMLEMFGGDGGALYYAGKIYLCEEEDITSGQLLHELAHAVVEQSPEYADQRGSEALSQFVEESLRSLT